MPAVKSKTKQSRTISADFLLPEAIQKKLHKAFSASGVAFSPDFYASLALNLQEKSPKGDRECADLVEQELARAELFGVLKRFLLLEDDTVIEGHRDTIVSCKETIEEYINKVDWRINANANVGYSNAGLKKGRIYLMVLFCPEVSAL